MTTCADVGSFIESKTSVVQTSNVGFTSEVSDYLVVHTGPGEHQSLRTLPNIAMQTDIRRYGARPVDSAGPKPGLGPPAATGKANQEEKSGQQAKSLSSHLETSAVPLVFAQWNAEGLRKKKTRATGALEKWESGHHQETHLTDAHSFTLRGYELFRHDRADRHKKVIVTVVRNTIPAVEVGRSGGDSEHLAIRVVVQGRDHSDINCYCPPDRDLQLHTLPLDNHNLLITTSMATLQAGDMLISIAWESK